MVEVFSTNITTGTVAQKILNILLDEHPKYIINFDLDDCDRILRVEGDKISPSEIVEKLVGLGYSCVRLE